MLTERLNVLLTVALMTAPMQVQAVDPLVLQNALAGTFRPKPPMPWKAFRNPVPNCWPPEVITAR